MEYWVSNREILLIVIFDFPDEYQKRSHPSEPIIPTFQYSNTPWHRITAIPPVAGLNWPEF
jgi:hypothetical protein